MIFHDSARSRTVRQAWSSLCCSTLVAAALLVLATGCGKTDDTIRGNVEKFATRIASLEGRAEVNVDLGFTDVTDDDLASLEFPDMVTQIDLRYTQVTDAGLVHLKKIPFLERVNLSGTRVSDAGVDRLRELPNLCYVELQNSLMSQEKQLELGKELIPRQSARIARKNAAAARHPAPNRP